MFSYDDIYTTFLVTAMYCKMSNLSLFFDNQTCAAIPVVDEPIIFHDDVPSDPMSHYINLNIPEHRNWPFKIQTFIGCHVLFVCLYSFWILFCTSYRVQKQTHEDKEEDFKTMAEPVLRQPDTPVTDTSLSVIEEAMEEEDTNDESTDVSSTASDTVNGSVDESVVETVLPEPPAPFVPRRSRRLAQQRRKQQAVVLDAVNAFIDNAIDHHKIE